jgi:hypothetical protein
VDEPVDHRGGDGPPLRVFAAPVAVDVRLTTETMAEILGVRLDPSVAVAPIWAHAAGTGDESPHLMIGVREAGQLIDLDLRQFARPEFRIDLPHAVVVGVPDSFWTESAPVSLQLSPGVFLLIRRVELPPRYDSLVGVTDPKMLTRHRDVALPRGRKPDTSDNFPFEEIRRRVFAETDPTDQGMRGGLQMEKYNVAGLNVRTGLIATAFAGALQAERVKAMPILSIANVAAAAAEAAAAKFRAGPRLVTIGHEAAKVVANAGHKLGSEDKSDLFGVAGDGTGDERMRDTIEKARALLRRICEVEKADAARATERFENALVALSPEFKNLV